MKCPHCEYEHGYGWANGDAPEDDWRKVDGKFGEFYESPIKMARNEDTYERETKALYGCPACNKTFIGE